MTATATIILAAGRSTRMGEPKALLRFRGRTFVEHSADVFGRLGSVVIMTSRGLDAAVADLVPGAAVGRNPRPEHGLFSSVRLGVELLPPGTNRVFVLPVDCLLPDETVPERMLVRASKPGCEVAVPVFHGVRGHPVLLNEAVCTALLTMAPTEVFSDVLGRFRVAEVPVAQEWILLNINNPNDYNDFLERERFRGGR